MKRIYPIIVIIGLLAAANAALQKATFFGLPAWEDSGTPGTLVTDVAGDGGDVLAATAGYVVSLDELDIRRYGAVSAEADATADIQACIDAAAAAGKTVLIPAGTWNISQITLPSDFHLKIAAGATVNQITGSDVDMIVNDTPGGGGNVNIHLTCHGTLDGNGANQAANSDILAFTNVAGLVIDGTATITDAQAMGIMLDTVSNFVVRGVRQTDSYVNDGCKVFSSSYGLFDDCWFTANVDGVGGYGLTLSITGSGNSHILIVNCNLSDNDDEGFVCFGATDVHVKDCWIRNNLDSGCHTDGNTRLLIDGCAITGNANQGIGSSESNGVNDLLVERCDISSNGGYGIFHQTTGGTFKDNVIASNGANGIRAIIATGTIGTIISGNRITNNGQAADAAGIWLGYTTACMVCGNHCDDDQETATQTYAVYEYVTGIGTSYILGNTSYRNKTGGFSLQAGSDAVDANNNTVAR